jgi:hypothetical protein
MRREKLEAYYKLSRTDGTTLHGRPLWPEGEWQEVEGDIVPCRNGLHVVTARQMLYWIRPLMIVWRVEIDPDYPIVADRVNTVVRRARIVERTRWQLYDGYMLAADFAEQVLPVFEDTFPGIRYPHEAIEATRRMERYEWPVSSWHVIYSRDTPNHPAWNAARAAWAASLGFVHDCAMSARKAGASEQDQVARLMTYL